MRDALVRTIPILLAAVAFGLALWSFPFDCDGAIAVHDGAAYGVGANLLDRGSISPHHPLFHVLALGLVPPLRALGVPHAGHVAVRILSGAGAAWILLQIAFLAGRRRLLTGAAFALVVLASGGFIVEAGLGETVLPGVAAALFTLVIASRPGTSLLTIGAALAFALLLRQDNLFIVPGVAIALAAARPEGARAAAVAKVLAWSALATILGYVASWIAGTGGAMPFFVWLLWLAQWGPWVQRPFEWGALADYLGSLSNAMTGPFWPPGESRPWLGAAYLAAIVCAGVLLRGTLPNRRFAFPAGLTLTIWALFHSWWLPSNFEWLVAAAVVLLAMMSGLARGEPATSPVSRRAGAALLLGLTAWTIFAATPHLTRYRERRLAEAIEDTVAIDRGARLVAVGDPAITVLALMEIEAAPVVPGKSLDDIIARIGAEVGKSNGRTIVLSDRFALDPRPRGQSNHPKTPIDSMEEPPGIRFLRRDGLVYGAVLDAPGPDSR
jgi:hypothetical protein